MYIYTQVYAYTYTGAYEHIHIKYLYLAVVPSHVSDALECVEVKHCDDVPANSSEILPSIGEFHLSALLDRQLPIVKIHHGIRYKLN